MSLFFLKHVEIFGYCVIRIFPKFFYWFWNLWGVQTPLQLNEIKRIQRKSFTCHVLFFHKFHKIDRITFLFWNCFFKYLSVVYNFFICLTHFSENYDYQDIGRKLFASPFPRWQPNGAATLTLHIKNNLLLFKMQGSA